MEEHGTLQGCRDEKQCEWDDTGLTLALLWYDNKCVALTLDESGKTYNK